jgi:hypothetical protein
MTSVSISESYFPHAIAKDAFSYSCFGVAERRQIITHHNKVNQEVWERVTA